MKIARIAASWLRTGLIASVTGLISLSAMAQFTPRASPEPLVRNVAVFGNMPTAGQTTLFAISLGGGMFKGIDDGATIAWTPFATTLPTTRLFTTFFMDINTLYVSTDGYGVQKSTNGGTTFAGINGAGGTALGCLHVRNVARISDAGIPTLFAGTDCPRSSGIWKSANDGTTWSRVGVGTIPEDSTINTITTTGNGSLMIAATQTNGLFRSIDAGATWAPANTGIPNSPLQAFPTGQNIVCGANCSTFVMVNIQGVGVYKSLDGGLTWSDSSTGLPASRATPSGMNRDPTTAPFTYFVTIDGEGVYSSVDDGASWAIWGNTDTDPAVKYVRSVVPSGAAGKYYVNKFNGVSRTLDSGATWYTSNLGRGSYRAIAHDPAFPGVAYAVSTTLWKLPDINAPVPTPLNNGIKGLMTNGNVYQVPFSPQTLFVSTDNYGLFASDDRGLTWGPENTGIPELLGQAFRMAFDTVNQGTIYIGSGGVTGIGMYKTTDGNWFEINTGLPAGPARTINRILIDRTNANTIWIATGAGVYKSTNAGASWSPVYNPADAGAPLPTFQIFQGSTPTELYIANSHVTPGGATLASSGVLKSINGGTTWTVILAGRAENLRLLQGDVLIAGLNDGPGTPAVKRSSNKGVSWENISTGLTGSDIRTFGVALNGSGLISASLEDGFYTFNGVQTVAFSAPTYTVAEGTPTVTVTVTRTGGSTGTVAVQYAVTGGTATAGSDFTLAAGTINFAAGVTSMTISIPITNDTTIEAPETIQLRLTGASSPAGNVILGPPANVNTTVTITDNDSVIEWASTAPLESSEGGPNVMLTLTRSGSTGVAQAVTFTTANGTATAGTDFGTSAAQVTGTVTFAPGETIKTIAVGKDTVPAPWIRIIDDVTVEGPEAFTVTLSAPTAGASLGTNKVATVNITSNENGVSMSTATFSAVNESSGVIEIFATRNGTVGAVDVSFTCVNGTATNGTHYQCVNGTFHWNDGENGQKSVLVNITDNAEVNANRTFSVTLSGATGATLVAPMSTAVTIQDNDSSVQFSAPTAVVTEGTANVVLTVTRTGATAGTAQATWTAADGSGFAGTDYGINGNPTPPSGTVSWAALDGASKTITIPILDDLLIDGAKTFTVTLSAPVGPNLNLGANVSTVTINDNEKSIAFQQPTYVVMEGMAPNTVTLTVVRSGAVNVAASATWATANGTAESGKDFGLLNNLAPRTGTVTWAVGDAANKTIVIPILNDAIGGEGAETFTVTLTPGAGYVLGPNGTATVTINDDDIPPQSKVEFSQPKYLVLENGGSVVLTVNRVDLGGGFGLAATVKFAAVAGTALAASDYTAPAATASLSWGVGDSAAKIISIPIVNNAIAEPTETFKVVLSAPSAGLGLGAPSEAMVLILDDDEAFPLDGAIPPGFSTPAGVTKGWHVSNDPGAYEGVFTLKAEEIDDGDTAGIEMSGTFVGGNVSFRVKVSTEPGFDVLTFYVDGVPQPLTWSGTTVAGWTLSPTYPLLAGVHTLRWVYSKDGSVSLGQDAVWIDGLVTPTFTP